MKVFALAAGAAMLAIAATADAQTAAAPIAPVQNTNAVLRTGTEVPLELSEMLTTKNKAVKIGQRVRLQVAQDVSVQNVVVIPAGSPAMGEIIEVRNQGMWGKSGHFGARVLYVTVNGRQIRMSGAFDEKGTAGGIGAVAASSILLPAGFFIKGTNAKLDVGTPVKGFVDEDVPLAMANNAVTPLQVGAPAPNVAPAVPAATLTPVSQTKNN